MTDVGTETGRDAVDRQNHSPQHKAINMIPSGIRLSRLAIAVAVLVCAAAPAFATDLTGTWTGHWEDHTNNHCGPLKARFSKCGDNHYRVTFCGLYHKIIPFRYTVVLDVAKIEGDKVYLQGSSTVPIYGTFTYSAEATACEFVAHYTSCKFVGRFVLARCCH
jgi:hypothetical protein